MFILYFLIICVLLLVLYFLLFRTGIKPDTEASYPELKFNKNESFKILQLTDLHIIFPFGKTIKRDFDNIRKTVEKEKPRLVAVTGDLALSPLNFIIYDKFEKLMEDLGIKWAVCFGNHDCHLGFCKSKLLKRLLNYKNCLNAASPKNLAGYTDFPVILKDQDGNPVFELLFMDSGSYIIYDGKIDYSCITEDQKIWFIETVQNTGELDNIVFCHFPVPEVSQLVLTKDYTGTMLDKPTFSKKDTDIFSSACRNGTQAFFFGHDHRNDFCGTVAGVILAYGRLSGSSVYKARGIKPGARIIRLDNLGSKIVTSTVDF